MGPKVVIDSCSEPPGGNGGGEGIRGPFFCGRWWKVGLSETGRLVGSCCLSDGHKGRDAESTSNWSGEGSREIVEGEGSVLIGMYYTSF